MAEEKKETNKTAKTAAKKPAAKKAAPKKEASKATTSKSSARKKTAKAAASKSTTAKKAAAKKPATKKAAASSKEAPKKSTAKKPATKKDTSKKADPKKTAEVKAAEKKDDAKKPAAKKAQAPKLVKVKKKSDKKKDGESGKRGIFGRKNKDTKKKSKKKKEEAPKLTKSQQNKLKRKKIKEENKRRRSNRDNILRKKAITKRAIGAFVISCAAFCVVVFGFMIFGKLQPNAGLAMRIDDYELNESDVTKYISTSTYYSQYKSSQSKWASFLGTYGMTASTFRNQVIESPFKEQELVKRACEKEGIEISDEEVDNHVQNTRNKFSSESAYKEAIEKMGYTTDTYWEHIKYEMQKKALEEKECPADTPSDSDVVTYLSSYKSSYTGAKQSAHILISDKTKAQEVLDKIKNNEISFEDAVKQYSEDSATKDNGGDMGWDKVSSHVSGYDSALSGISKGDVGTTIVSCPDGYHIIKCTDVWTASESISSLDGIPTPIVEYCRTKKKESTQDTSLTTWLNTFVTDNGINVEIYPMPSSVPYNVTPTSSSSSTTSSSSTSSDTTSTTTDGTTTTTTS